MFDRILVAVDGTPSSFSAALFGASVASRRGTIHLLCVTDRRSPPITGPLVREPSLEHRCETALASAQAALGGRALVAERRIVGGRALPAILQMEDEIGADLVCVGSGRSRLGIGSVSAAVVRESRAAVALLREESFSIPRIERIAVGARRGPTALAAARRAFQLAAGTGASLLLVSVVPDRLPSGPRDATREDAASLLEELGREAADGGLPPPESRLLVGDPAIELLHAAQSFQADVLVVGAGVSRPLRPMGRVAGHLASTCTSPLLICRVPPGPEMSVAG